MFKVDNNIISMIRGDSGVFTITITDANGSPVELTGSDCYQCRAVRGCLHSTLRSA